MNGFTLLAPGGFLLGVGVAAALAILHAITVGRPRPAWLPTARFAPDRAPSAARRLARPADRWLLALRVLAALLAAVALARPVRDPARRRVARVVLADLSQPAARAAVRDSVRALVENGDVLVPFAAAPQPALLPATPAPPHTTSPATHRATLDSTLTAAARTLDADIRPSLSAALVAARRTAPAVAATADSIELIVVSPLARELVDPATMAVRSAWRGRVRVVNVGSPPPSPGTQLSRPRAFRSSGSRQVTLRGGPPDDALAAAVALAGIATTEAASIRVLRSAPSPADISWAAESSHTFVIWPASAAVTGRATPEAAEALMAGDRVAAGAFGRLPANDAATGPLRAARGSSRIPSLTVARWRDGAPAAVEEGFGRGCLRTVAVRVPQTGDAALRPSFLTLLPSLLGPCGSTRDTVLLAAEDVARLAGTGPLLAAAPLRAPRSASSRDPIGATLLALAAALLLFELPLRRMTRRAPRSDDAVADFGDAAAPEPTNATAPRTAA